MLIARGFIIYYSYLLAFETLYLFGQGKHFNSPIKMKSKVFILFFMLHATALRDFYFFCMR